MWNIVKGGHKPTSSPRKNNEAVLQFGRSPCMPFAFCPLQSQQDARCWCLFCLWTSPRAPRFIREISQLYSEEPSLLCRGLLSCLKGNFILMPRESVNKVCGCFRWRTSTGIQPAPRPPVQFHHETRFLLLSAFFTLPLNTLLTICVSLLPGILLLHQTVDSNFINV